MSALNNVQIVYGDVEKSLEESEKAVVVKRLDGDVSLYAPCRYGSARPIYHTFKTSAHIIHTTLRGSSRKKRDKGGSIC